MGQTTSSLVADAMELLGWKSMSWDEGDDGKIPLSNKQHNFRVVFSNRGALAAWVSKRCPIEYVQEGEGKKENYWTVK
jgi:hypothetical protein